MEPETTQQLMAETMQQRSKIEETLGKQAMQTAVLRWAVANAAKLHDAGLADSLIQAMADERSN